MNEQMVTNRICALGTKVYKHLLAQNYKTLPFADCICNNQKGRQWSDSVVEFIENAVNNKMKEK
tara:strand:+ start:2958 stop:3149 length:192 start_codon:yes stop_codon:yes gene_type:complete